MHIPKENNNAHSPQDAPTTSRLVDFSWRSMLRTCANSASVCMHALHASHEWRCDGSPRPELTFRAASTWGTRHLHLLKSIVWFVRTRACVCAWCACACACAYTCLCVCACMHVCVCARACMCTCLCVCMHVCVCGCVCVGVRVAWCRSAARVARCCASAWAACAHWRQPDLHPRCTLCRRHAEGTATTTVMGKACSKRSFRDMQHGSKSPPLLSKVSRCLLLSWMRCSHVSRKHGCICRTRKRDQGWVKQRPSFSKVRLSSGLLFLAGKHTSMKKCLPAKHKEHTGTRVTSNATYMAEDAR